MKLSMGLTVGDALSGEAVGTSGRGRDEGPMVLPFGALFDPFPEQPDLFGREGLVAFWRRHEVVRIAGRCAGDDGAGLRVAGMNAA